MRIRYFLRVLLSEHLPNPNQDRNIWCRFIYVSGVRGFVLCTHPVGSELRVCRSWDAMWVYVYACTHTHVDGDLQTDWKATSRRQSRKNVFPDRFPSFFGLEIHRFAPVCLSTYVCTACNVYVHAHARLFVDPQPCMYVSFFVFTWKLLCACTLRIHQDYRRVFQLEWQQLYICILICLDTNVVTICLCVYIHTYIHTYTCTHAHIAI